MVKSGFNQEFSTQEKCKIKEVHLTLFDPEEIKALSVCRVSEVTLIDRDTNEARENSLADPRMGPRLKHLKCKTCMGNLVDCPGHFGHIELARPVYHFGFLNVIKKVLSCICYKCHKLKSGDKNKVERLARCALIKDNEKKLNQIYKLLRNGKCKGKDPNQNEPLPEDQNKMSIEVGCGTENQPQYTIDTSIEFAIIQTFKKKDDSNPNIDPKNKLSAQAALDMLQGISEEDMKFLGFDGKYNKPQNMILTVIPVAPPHVRPSVERGPGQYSEDDLTHQYIQILKANEALEKAISSGQPSHSIDELNQLLQFYVTTFSKNDYARKSQHKNGRPIKSIRDRISSKEGRIRGNLMGKRVDFSARTVISPDPNLALDELGVPRTIAANLTFPEPVTQRNHDFLTGLVKKASPWAWPGAKYVRKRTGEIFDLRIAKEVNLEIGDVVERHIMDGDYVLFNRQPSLHKMSMMSHRIRVLPFSSFRLNLSVTKPYNADFDGDEMNMHVPQSYETKAELREIMYVPRQIVSPKANQPVMGIEQDALTGVRHLTKRNVFITIDECMNLFMHIPPELWDSHLPEPAILKPQRLWTGKQVLSKILPKVNIEQEANGAPKDAGPDFDKSLPDCEVLIRKGEILKGMLDIKMVGTSRNGLVHTIWLEYGHERAKNFLTDTQRIVNNWLAGNAHTVGISDTIASQDVFEQIEDVLKQAQSKVDSLINQTERGDLEFQPGKGLIESLEQTVNGIMNDIRDKAGDLLLKRVDPRNNILHMVNAGSKGKTENLCQILACVGQQNIEGRRIPFGFVERSLPHFTKFDYGPRSKGFVENCYLKGLKPDEFFFHTMGGREGLIDTAVKTSETGYIQRKLVKSIEDVMIKYDGTVRDSRGNVIQFLYGEDGMAGEFIEEIKMDLIEFNDDRINKVFGFGPSDNLMLDNIEEPLHASELERIKQDRDDLRKIFPISETVTKSFFLPVNVDRLIKNCKIEFKSNPKEASKLSVGTVIESVNNLIARLVVVSGKDKISIESQNNGTLLLSIYIRFSLAAKKVILGHKLTDEAFNWLIGQIETLFQRARGHPGEMVGAIAAQSISEPTTQMTLNTFHMAGISAKNVTLGVPRIKEIINKATNIKTPGMTIHLKDEYKYNKDLFHIAKMDFEFTLLKHVTERSQIIFDPDPIEHPTFDEPDFDLATDIQILYDKQWEEIQANPARLSPWFLRIEITKDLHSTMAGLVGDIILSKTRDLLNSLDADKIRKQFLVVSNNFGLAITNDRNPVLRVHLLRRDAEEYKEEAELLKQIEKILFDKIHISGITKVKKLYNKNRKGDKVYTISADGTLQKGKPDQQIWFYETDGTNLRAAFAFEYVDHKKTSSNDINEILSVLGIEAARRALLDEIRKVMQPYGISINYRHLAVLCDDMTQRGYIMPINRNGINRIDCGPLRKCSFEETLDMILEAAAYGAIDPLTGISENVMLGQLCRLGTGSFDLVIDVKKLADPRYIPDQVIQHEEETAFELGLEGVDQIQTPLNPNTPGPGMFMQAPSSVYAPDMMGSFTPQAMSMMSPAYTPQMRTPLSNVNSPKPQLSAFSPTYESITSQLFGGPTSAPHQSPTYSPFGSISYNPSSPHYSATSSPSLSSSGGGTRVYSPSSPGLSQGHSPRYSPTYSPRSPGYSSPSNTNTPSSANPNTHPYTPNSPSYNRTVYNPTSPAYDPTATIREADHRQEEDEDDEDEEKKQRE